MGHARDRDTQIVSHFSNRATNKQYFTQPRRIFKDILFVEMAKESEFQTETQFLDHLSVQVISRIYFASARLDLHVPGDVHNKHFRQSSQLRACRRPTYS